jgi:hypothetical protein
MAIATARPLGYRPRPEPFWRSGEAFFTDAGLLILGAAGAYNVNFVGSIPGCEVLLFAILPILLLYRGRRAFDRQYLWFYILVGAWLLGTLIADEYNAIVLFNRAKGVARVVFFALDFMALAILLNNRTRRIVIFALSIAGLDLISSLQYRPNIEVQWKFGLSEGLAIVVLLVSSHFYVRRRYGICFLVFIILAALNLRYGFRSQLAVHFVSAVLVLPFSNSQARLQRSGSRGQQDTYRVVILLALVGVAAYGANAAIKYATRSGLFDESTQAKFETQSGGDLGVLVGGRPETLVAIQAIRDSPFIGHGSFPYGPEYMQMKQDIQYEHGYSDSDVAEEVEYPVIPTHSHLTLAWVEGGILGGICWIYILALTVRGILRLSTQRPPLAPLYCYLLVAFLWDILYSPFGSVSRIMAAFYILLIYNQMKIQPREALPGRRQKVNLKYGARQFRLARRGAY